MEFAFNARIPLGANARNMNTSPLSNQFGPQLQKLDREIQDSLSEVRRHIQELEQAEKTAENKTHFADLLKESLDE